MIDCEPAAYRLLDRRTYIAAWTRAVALVRHVFLGRTESPQSERPTSDIRPEIVAAYRPQFVACDALLRIRGLGRRRRADGRRSGCPATLAHFTMQYQTARSEWNDGVQSRPLRLVAGLHPAIEV